MDNIVWTLVANCFCAHERDILGFFFPELGSKKGNKHQNHTWVSAEIVCYECTYVILFLTRHDGTSNDTKKIIFAHWLTADHVTIDYKTHYHWDVGT